VTNLPPNILADIDAINRISVVPTILEVICRTTGMGFAAVARVTEDRWVACSVRDEINFGLKSGGELKLETTICNEIRQSGQGVVIDHVAIDECFANHHTPAMYGFQSYISIPIKLKNGRFFGTLCAIDPKPAILRDSAIVSMFNLYVDLIAFHLEALDELAKSEADLREERQMAELREQFIAILGHDLRNPLSAVNSVAQLLKRMPLEEKIKRMANILQDSAYRMSSLVDNLMDFARARLGEGIVLKIKQNEPLDSVLTHIIEELKLIWPNKVIETDFDKLEPFTCDGKRIGQLFSNLLGNALTHGSIDAPVNVSASVINGQLKLAVSNGGEQISAEAMQHLFKPFSRGQVKKHQEGLGLGLYIASEIAKAHKGALTVSSNPERTTFELIIPSIN
jgi:signal transduction histidine kinase